MNRFFLPLPVVYPAMSDSYTYAQIQQVEQYLDVAVCLLRQTAERLRDVSGADALGTELTAFLNGNDLLEQSKLVGQLDLSVKEKSREEAVRLFRERFDVTWDQAFELHDCWPRWDRTNKLRCLQMIELRRLYAAIAERTHQESSEMKA